MNYRVDHQSKSVVLEDGTRIPFLELAQGHVPHSDHCTRNHGLTGCATCPDCLGMYLMKVRREMRKEIAALEKERDAYKANYKRKLEAEAEHLERIAELRDAITEHLERLERTNTSGLTHSVCHNGLYEAVAKPKGDE